MGPKSVTASLPSKNLSWLDRMYMKVENICAEVDKNPSILLQDTSKFVESQMKVVGVNVKKLCNEIIQDLLPPPVFSSEVAEKKAECRVHCKCNCMEFEKPKQKDVDFTMDVANTNTSSCNVQPKGSENRKGAVEESILEKRNILMRDDMKVDVRNVGFEKLESCEVQGNNQKFSGEEPKQLAGCNEMGHGTKHGTEHVFEHVEAVHNAKQSAAAVVKHGTDTREEQLQIIVEQQRNNSSETEPTQSEEQEMLGQEESMLVTVRQSRCAEPAISASALNMEGELEELEAHSPINIEGEREELEAHGPINIEGEREELVRHGPFNTEGAREQLVIYAGHFAVDLTKNVEEHNTMIEEKRGLDVKDSKQAAEASCEMHASQLSNRSTESYASHDDAQKISDVEILPFGMLEYARLLGSMEATEVVGAEKSQKGVDIGFMYSYVFNENSRSSQDSMILSEYLHEEEDGEQTARWLVPEDLRNIIHPENFSADIPQQTESSMKALDFDWELV